MTCIASPPPTAPHPSTLQCDPCSLAKRRCDGQPQCSLCKKKGLRCVYGEASHAEICCMWRMKTCCSLRSTYVRISPCLHRARAHCHSCSCIPTTNEGRSIRARSNLATQLEPPPPSRTTLTTPREMSGKRRDAGVNL